MYGSDNFVSAPKDYRSLISLKYYGKVTGRELITGVVEGKFNGATVGEGSFIEAVAQGLPIVAVAELGHDSKEQPTHAMIFRDNIDIREPSDLKGKKIVTREAGPSEEIFLREFLRDEGVNENEVLITDQVEIEALSKGIFEGTFDGAYAHLMAIEELIERWNAPIYIYRPLNWVNPELSTAVLVFHKDFVKNNPEAVEKILRAYMKHIALESALPETERQKRIPRGFRTGLQIEFEYAGMNLPQYDLPPTISLELMTEMQNLLFRHGYIDHETDLHNFIDNSFVEKIYAQEFEEKE
jgi:ABC-type nitrate/sulfonate/bicarbonate transport system substrate-binding protein